MEPNEKGLEMVVGVECTDRETPTGWILSTREDMEVRVGTLTKKILCLVVTIGQINE